LLAQGGEAGFLDVLLALFAVRLPILALAFVAAVRLLGAARTVEFSRLPTHAHGIILLGFLGCPSAGIVVILFFFLDPVLRQISRVSSTLVIDLTIACVPHQSAEVKRCRARQSACWQGRC
jgi:hypothetical protein